MCIRIPHSVCLCVKFDKIEYDASCVAFSEFINDHSLSQAQIVLVKKVIDYILQNGYIEYVAELTKPLFDKTKNFIKLFNGSKQKRILKLVNQMSEHFLCK